MLTFGVVTELALLTQFGEDGLAALKSAVDRWYSAKLTRVNALGKAFEREETLYQAGDMRVWECSLSQNADGGGKWRTEVRACAQVASVDTSKPAICGRVKPGHFRAGSVRD